MRVALVYDCLYPCTVGGAERWLRRLAEDLAPDHRVAYLTRRQWRRGEEPSIDGVEVVPVAPGGALYTAAGARRLLPLALFGVGVFLHFVRRRSSYDVVHCVSYPYTGLIALRLALLGRSDVRVFCEWIECPTAEYWRAYAGRLGGTLGRLVQRLCARLSPAAFVFSDLVASRLREEGFRGELHRLPGLWVGEPGAPPSGPANGAGTPLVLAAGRHVPDKRVDVVAEALTVARRDRPELRGVIVGDGPERPRLVTAVRELDPEGSIALPGFVERGRLEQLLGTAACYVSASVREGHGMAVFEAIARGVPAVVCRHPDNAATETVEEGVNGAVAPTAAPADIGAAILRVLAAGEGLRRSTEAWSEANAERFSAGRSIEQVRAAYGGAPPV